MRSCGNAGAEGVRVRIPESVMANLPGVRTSVLYIQYVQCKLLQRGRLRVIRPLPVQRRNTAHRYAFPDRSAHTGAAATARTVMPWASPVMVTACRCAEGSDALGAPDPSDALAAVRRRA
ncbi:hypothetical protein GCM10010319_44070 [Streptomyces blastmyceticus]|uniref:Uncharacterized protein n=1 Tax=Streptomyces blastmyceticus TaxID=68180 RepID=A0ABP3H7P4_9ACTN